MSIRGIPSELAAGASSFLSEEGGRLAELSRVPPHCSRGNGDRGGQIATLVTMTPVLSCLVSPAVEAPRCWGLLSEH